MTEHQMMDEIIRLKEQLRDLNFRHYFDFELFSWRWFLMLALFIIPLAIWWKTVDKKRLLIISFFGLLMNVAAAFLDVMGSEYSLWDYSNHILPGLSLLIPVDYVILPVIQMAIYQHCPKWGRYLLVSLLASAFQAFVAEPLAVLIREYLLINWKYIYSFPIYFLLGVIAKALTDRFLSVQQKALQLPAAGKKPGKKEAPPSAT